MDRLQCTDSDDVLGCTTNLLQAVVTSSWWMTFTIFSIKYFPKIVKKLGSPAVCLILTIGYHSVQVVHMSFLCLVIFFVS